MTYSIHDNKTVRKTYKIYMPSHKMLARITILEEEDSDQAVSSVCSRSAPFVYAFMIGNRCSKLEVTRLHLS